MKEFFDKYSVYYFSNYEKLNFEEILACNQEVTTDTSLLIEKILLESQNFLFELYDNCFSRDTEPQDDISKSIDCIKFEDELIVM